MSILPLGIGRFQIKIGCRWQVIKSEIFLILLWFTTRHGWKFTVICLPMNHKDLTSTTPWANSAGNKLMIFFFNFPENRNWHFMQFVSSMKLQNLFSGGNKKNVSKCCVLKILPRVPGIYYYHICLKYWVRQSWGNSIYSSDSHCLPLTVQLLDTSLGIRFIFELIKFWNKNFKKLRYTNI